MILDCVSGFIKINKADTTSRCTGMDIPKLEGTTPPACAEQALQHGLNQVNYNNLYGNCVFKNCSDYDLTLLGQTDFNTYTRVYSC